MVAEPQTPLLTPEEYLALEAEAEERHEFINGHMYALAGGTIDHSVVSVAVTSILRGALRNGPCRVCSSDARVRISANRYLYPDASVTCDMRDRGDQPDVSFPRVIVEVLSLSTEAYDRGDKFAYYRTCPSIDEYVLVSTRRRSIEVYRRAGDVWSLHTFGHAHDVELTSIGVRFPVAEIYADGEMPE